MLGSKLLVLGMVIQPLMAGILKKWVQYIKPYGLGLMSLSPKKMEMSWELSFDPSCTYGTSTKLPFLVGG